MVLTEETETLVLALRDVMESRLRGITPTVNNQPADVHVTVDMTPVAEAINRMTEQIAVQNELSQRLLVVLTDRDPTINVHPPSVQVMSPTVNVQAPRVRVDGPKIPPPVVPVANEQPRPVSFRLETGKDGVKRLFPEYE